MDKEFLMGLMEMPEAVAAAILEEHGKALEGLQGQLREATVNGAVGQAITALLDMAALREAEDVEQAATEAVAAVKKECGYLFTQAVPGYAAGTGARVTGEAEEPMSLADALKEKFGR